MRFQILVLISTVLLFSACVPTQNQYFESSECTLKSFNFLANKNSGFLDSDFVAEINDSAPIQIGPFSSFTDRTDLVPTFDVSPLTQVFIDNKPVISGLSRIDFSSTKEIFVIAENGTEKKYTIKTYTSVPPRDITIAGYNVEDFAHVGCPADIYTQIAQVLKNNSIEVAVLVETAKQDKLPLQSALKQIEWIMPYYAITAAESDAISVFSKYPIKTSEILSSGTWPRTTFKIALTMGNSKTITLFGNHLKAMSDDLSLVKRKAQAKALADYIRANYAATLNTEAMVILGDLNTTSSGDFSGADATLTYLQLKDDSDSGNDFWAANFNLVPNSYTWTNTQATSLLDHIILSPTARLMYISDTLKIPYSDVLSPQIDMSKLSDHFPVILDLEL